MQYKLISLLILYYHVVNNFNIVLLSIIADNIVDLRNSLLFGQYLYVSLTEEKTGDSLVDNQFNSSVESSSKLEADQKINEINSSKFARLKRGFLFVFSWIIFPFWHLIGYFKFPRLGGCRREIFKRDNSRVMDFKQEIDKSSITFCRRCTCGCRDGANKKRK